jgi:ATP-dependent helicase HepA
MLLEDESSVVPMRMPQAHYLLKVGMQVRIPEERNRIDGQFRQFYLGRIEEVDDLSDTVLVRLHHRELDGEITIEDVTCPRIWAQRCRVLPDTKVALSDRDAGGVLLVACDLHWTPGKFCEYYVQINGATQRISESNLIAASHRADPDPQQQLATYEFQNPSFLQPRNALVESYAELRAATFGVEDLVGSRIMLLAHQAEVIATVLSDAECRYILADEVGLGKTIEAAVILKGLRRRHPGLRTLVVAPAALVLQWYYELDHKFWLRFALPSFVANKSDLSSPSIILSHEQLANPKIASAVMAQHWDLLIVDEAHNVPKRLDLDELVQRLSAKVSRVLLLSATPIQRHASEFLSLLKLLHPARYQHISDAQFKEMSNAQLELQRIVARLVPDLTPDYFDPDDFCEEMNVVLELLRHDKFVTACINKVKANRQQMKRALSAAHDAIAYISENYRLERRVIRNRRSNLQIALPVRVVDESYAYTPTDVEASALDELHEYADALLAEHPNAPYVQEMVRLLLHAAFSSPAALLEILQLRQTALTDGPVWRTEVELQRLIASTSPRQELDRTRELLQSIPESNGERVLLDRAIWQAQRWHDEILHTLEKLPYLRRIPAVRNRIGQVIHAVDQYLQKKPDGKIVIFAHWLSSLKALHPFLRKQIGKESVFQFNVDLSEEELQDQVVGFQECTHQAVLLCDELGGEGRNFQMADLIIHLDLPWAPAKIEQRIGRVDRIGRHGEVVSVVPYAREQIEQDLFQIWQQSFELFTRSMSGMEIVLEGIQNELAASLCQGTRNGLVRTLPSMVERAEWVREQVEEERYYEERAVNNARRDEFAHIHARYEDGSILRDPLLDWATQAGLVNRYHSPTDTVTYFPRDFSQASMHNAKFKDVPNMEDAVARSRRASSLRIEGTFNRAVAQLREDLIFFAPGSDPWTDSIIRNAIEADRGRCCAICRGSAQITNPVLLFDLTYRVQVDPRPLLELGYDPIHLLRAQGYLFTPIHHVLITYNGERVASSHPLAKLIQSPFSKKTDRHAGQRSGDKPPLDWFKKQFPEESWHVILEQVFSAAQSALTEDFAFMQEMATEALDRYVYEERGLRAAAEWYIAHGAIPDVSVHMVEIDSYRTISSALVAGLGQPLYTLESACCWLLLPARS